MHPLRHEMARLRRDLQAVRIGSDTRVARLRAEMTTQLAQLRAQLWRQRLDRQHERIEAQHRRLLVRTGVQLSAIAAIAFRVGRAM